MPKNCACPRTDGYDAGSGRPGEMAITASSRRPAAMRPWQRKPQGLQRRRGPNDVGHGCPRCARNASKADGQGGCAITFAVPRLGRVRSAGTARAAPRLALTVELSAPTELRWRSASGCADAGNEHQQLPPRTIRTGVYGGGHVPLRPVAQPELGSTSGGGADDGARHPAQAEGRRCPGGQQGAGRGHHGLAGGNSVPPLMSCRLARPIARLDFRDWRHHAASAESGLPLHHCPHVIAEPRSALRLRLLVLNGGYCNWRALMTCSPGTRC